MEIVNVDEEKKQALFREIERYLDDENCITYRKLSSKFDLNVTESKNMLFEFYNENKNFIATFLVSGLKSAADKSSSFCLANADNLEETKKSFERVDCIHLYSLHRLSSEVYTQVSSIDRENFREWNINQLSNSMGHIQISDLLILPPGQRPPKDIINPSKHSSNTSAATATSSTATAKPPIAPVIARNPSSSKQVTETKEKEETTTTNTNNNSKNNSKGKSFFEKRSNTDPTSTSTSTTTATTTSTTTATTQPTLQKASSSSSTKSSQSENSLKRQTSITKKTTEKPPKPAKRQDSINSLIASEDEDDFQLDTNSIESNSQRDKGKDKEDDEAEWDDGTSKGANYYLDKQKIKKREEIESINKHFEDESSADEDENQDDNNESDSDGGEEKKNKKNESKKETKKKRKSTKKSSQKEPIELSSDGDENDKNEEESKGKKTKKRKKEEVVEQKIQIHGAMDDFFEDMAKKQADKANALGVSGQAKKKKQKLVEKIFTNEKGYIVTEMVYEDVDEDDNDGNEINTQASTTQPTNQPEKQPTKPAASGSGKETSKKGSKSAPVSKGQQRSMTSYFTKK